MKQLTILSFSLCTILFNLTATADETIYKYKDQMGHIVIGNTKTKDAKPVKLPPLSVYATPMSASDLNAPGYTAKNMRQSMTPVHQRITNTLGTNEPLRQQVLNEELAREQSMLADSKQVLAQGTKLHYPSEVHDTNKYNERITLLQNSVNEHEKNIQLLTQEFAH